MYCIVHTRHNRLKQINIRIIKWRYISAPRIWPNKGYSCFDFAAYSVFTFVYTDVAWVLLSSQTQVQTQLILNRDYLPDNLSVSYDYDFAYLSLLVIITFVI